jgi:hypothetical protein
MAGERRPRRHLSIRSLGWLAVLAMVFSTLLPLGASAAPPPPSNKVNSITGPSCFEGNTLSGTINVTVETGSFSFDIWAVDHVPGPGGTSAEVVGSRQTLTFTESGTYNYTLNISGRRAGADTLRVVQSTSNTSLAAIGP